VIPAGVVGQMLARASGALLEDHGPAFYGYGLFHREWRGSQSSSIRGASPGSAGAVYGAVAEVRPHRRGKHYGDVLAGHRASSPRA